MSSVLGSILAFPNSKHEGTMHILHVIGAQPKFHEGRSGNSRGSGNGIRQTLAHTAQHYDANMSDVFFQQLGIPEPDVNLAVNSDTPFFSR